MPLGPAPDYQGDRFFVDYEGPAGEHTVQFRFDPNTAAASMSTRAQAIINALKALVPASVSFNGARIALHGSGVTFPYAWTPIIGTNPTALVAHTYPAFASFVGRSATGRRTRLTVHGVAPMTEGDYRLTADQSPTVGTILTALTGGPPYLVSADLGAIIWNNYINVGYNAHFQRKRREVA